MKESRENHQNPLAPQIIEAAVDLWSQSGGSHYIRISGSSMLPLIKNGDQIQVDHRIEPIRRGDILVFLQEGQLIAHRLLRITRKQGGKRVFNTKGDHVLRMDPPLEADRVLGKVISIRRGERTMGLDTTIWHWLGWLISLVMLGWVEVYSATHAFKEAVFGSKPSRIPEMILKFSTSLLSLLLKTIETMFGHWRS